MGCSRPFEPSCLPWCRSYLCGGTWYPASGRSSRGLLIPSSTGPLAGLAKKTLLQADQQRFEGLANLGAPLLDLQRGSTASFVAGSRAQIGWIPPPSLLERFGRNTAPAIRGWRPSMPRPFGDDPLLLVLAADHVDPRRWPVFAPPSKPGRAAAEAASWSPRAFVAPPPLETGYGYIEAGVEPCQPGFADSGPSRPAGADRPLCLRNPMAARPEKSSPPAASPGTAGCSFSGQAPSWLSLKRLSPELVRQLPRRPRSRQAPSRGFCGWMREAFARLSANVGDSIVAVMERHPAGVCCCPWRRGWSDVGSWGKRSGEKPPIRISPATSCGAGDSARGSRNWLPLRSEHRLVVGLGVDDLVGDRNRMGTPCSLPPRPVPKVKTIVRQL